MFGIVKQAFTKKTNLQSKLKKAGTVLAGALLLGGASLAVASTPKRSMSFQIMDDKFKLIEKDKFLQNLNGAEKVRVVSTIGAIGSGKSTLLNKIFFNNEPAFKASDEDISVTRGIWGALTFRDINQKFGYSEEQGGPRDAPKHEAVLVLDSEGLFGPEKNSFNKGFALFMRLIAVSDVIITNFHGTINKDNAQTLEKASMLFTNDFTDVDIHHKPYLIVFCQRTNRLINRQSFREKFLSRDLIAFARLSVINSHDKTDPDENKIRLDTQELEKEINQYLQSDDTQTPLQIWTRLKSFEADALNTHIPDDVLTSAEYECPAKCKNCEGACMRKTIRSHVHFRSQDRCPRNHTSVTHYCPKCNEERSRFEKLTPKYTPWGFIGYGRKYDCSIHGTIDYGRKLFIPSELKAITREEHEFEQQQNVPKN